jgi:hypothetical protein
MLRLLALLAVPVFATVTDCNTSSLFRPTVLGLNPDPPISGQPVRLTVQFENPGPEITSGLATTSITLNGLPFSPSSEPLCQNTACPIVIGANDRSTSSTWPTNVKGRVVTKSVWTNDDGDELLCVQTSVKVGSSLLRPILNGTLDGLLRDDISLKRVSAWKWPTYYLWCPVVPFWEYNNTRAL